MNTRVLLKKILVILPVLVLSILYLKAHYRNDYHHLGSKRLFLLGLTMLLLYGWMFISVAWWKQDGLFPMLVQSSFFVYFFMVLTLTGYFILFREISTHGWWDNIVMRIHQEDHVNLKPFQIFKIYRLSDTQIVGNFIMLFPLGIYIPLLNKKLDNFFIVLCASMLVSVTIECLQLATRYRSADVDDVILNTAGACVGYIFYRVILLFRNQPQLAGT